MLFDTDVLIWYLRGNSNAADLLDQTLAPQISVISYMELMQSSRGNEHTRRIRSFLSEFNFVIVPLSENIGHRALIYMEELGTAIGLSVMDALIAATAVETDNNLTTGNFKHFAPIDELRVVRFKA